MIRKLSWIVAPEDRLTVTPDRQVWECGRGDRSMADIPNRLFQVEGREPESAQRWPVFRSGNSSLRYESPEWKLRAFILRLISQCQLRI